MSVQETVRIDEAFLESWNTQDAERCVALCADDIVWYDTGIPEPMHGKAAVRQYMQGWFTAFPDITSRAVNRLATEDSVAVELEWDGTNTGPMQISPDAPAMPPTGKVVHGKGAYFARVQSGKIVEVSAHPDVLGVMMQLGLMPGA